MLITIWLTNRRAREVRLASIELCSIKPIWSPKLGFTELSSSIKLRFPKERTHGKLGLVENCVASKSYFVKTTMHTKPCLIKVRLLAEISVVERGFCVKNGKPKACSSVEFRTIKAADLLKARSPEPNFSREAGISEIYVSKHAKREIHVKKVRARKVNLQVLPVTARWFLRLAPCDALFAGRNHRYLEVTNKQALGGETNLELLIIFAG